MPRVPQQLIWLSIVFAAWCCSIRPAHASGHAPAAEEEKVIQPEGGYDLGTYVVRDARNAENEKYKIEFQLYAELDPEQAAAFEHMMHEWEHRVRDQILTAVRLTPVELYEQPDLAGFRRRIFLRLRRAVPELPIKAVFVTDFRMVSEG